MEPDQRKKICPKCRLEKNFSEFHNSKNRKDGKDCYCAKCSNEKSRSLTERRRQEREKLIEKLPENHKKCPKCEKILSFDLFYTSAYSSTGRNSHCKECIKKTSKDRYKQDQSFREKLKLKRRIGYKKELSQGRDTRKEWARRNPERQNAITRRRNKKRVSTSIGKLEARILGLVKRSVLYRSAPRNEPSKWEEIFGYSFSDLKNHIEKLFISDMNWDVFKNEIDIDHIIPRSSFYYETVEDEDFKKCWALSNLQPLWKSDNRIKGDKMPDGTSGRLIGERKRRLLNEESSVAGYEQVVSQLEHDQD